MAPANSSSPVPIHVMSDAAVTAELADLIAGGAERPARSKIDASRPWKNGAPSYDRADLAFLRGRTRKHAATSLPGVLQDAVKAWEMEATHLELADWATVNHGQYKVAANGTTTPGAKAAQTGNYNWLMASLPKSLYDAETETFETSHTKFQTAFPGGFAWEVLEAYAGPPRAAFSWRHWALFDGDYEGRAGDGELYEMFGFAVVDLDEETKITSIEIYYKPEDFVRALKGEFSPAALRNGAALGACPALGGM